MPRNEGRPLRRSMLVLTLLAVSLTACSEVSDTVRSGIDEAEQLADDARERVEDTAAAVRFCAGALEVAAAVERRDWDAALDAARDAAAAAPDEIAADADTVVDGLETAQTGDETAVQDPAFREAAERLATYARDTCDPRG